MTYIEMCDTNNNISVIRGNNTMEMCMVGLTIYPPDGSENDGMLLNTSDICYFKLVSPVDGIWRIKSSPPGQNGRHFNR